jgi:hypothetical protein
MKPPRDSTANGRGGNRDLLERRPRVMKKRRSRFAAVGVLMAAAGLLVSCGAAPARPHATGTHTQTSASGRPWWYHGGVSPCAAPALVRTAGHVTGVGTCMGQFSKPPRKVTLSVGQRIDVHMTGAGLAQLLHSSFPSVLAPGAVSRDGATQTYRAARPGHAVLVSDGQACPTRGHLEAAEVPRSCPVISVTVVP